MRESPPNPPKDLPWGALAWCRVDGRAHGDPVVVELVQTRTGWLSRRYDDKPGAFTAADVKSLDLKGELDSLQTSTLPANRDPRRGKTATLEVVSGDRWVRVTFQRPLSTTAFRDDAVDRVYRAACGWPQP